MSGQSPTLRSKPDPTGNQQDCIGMTPLHIMTCSSVHDLELYRVIVEKYPANLITEDRWGALPLLYAFLGAAPAEIIQFLLDRYQSLYPGHVFNWMMMILTIGRTDAPNLLQVKQIHFPDQSIDWEYLLDEFSSPSHEHYSFGGLLFRKRMQLCLMYGMSTRVEALAFKVWRDYVTNMIQAATFDYSRDNLYIISRIQEKVAHFEDEPPKLKDIMTIF